MRRQGVTELAFEKVHHGIHFGINHEEADHGGGVPERLGTGWWFQQRLIARVLHEHGGSAGGLQQVFKAGRVGLAGLDLDLQPGHDGLRKNWTRSVVVLLVIL